METSIYGCPQQSLFLVRGRAERPLGGLEGANREEGEEGEEGEGARGAEGPREEGPRRGLHAPPRRGGSSPLSRWNIAWSRL